MAGLSEAIVGMVGVVVGGAITTVGTIWAQRLQMKATIAAEARARELSASVTVLTTLSQLLQMPDEPTLDPAENAHWHDHRQDLLRLLGAAVQDFGRKDLRDRMDEVHLILDLYSAAANLTAQTERHTRSIACRHALTCIGAFRRGEPIPARPKTYVETLNAIKEWNIEDIHKRQTR